MDFRGPELHFDVVVAEQMAQHAVGLPTGFAERGAVGIAQVFREQFRALQGQRTEFVGGHAELVGGGFPGVPVGAVLGGFEQGVVEDGLGGDHGGALMVVNVTCVQVDARL